MRIILALLLAISLPINGMYTVSNMIEEMEEPMVKSYQRIRVPENPAFLGTNQKLADKILFDTWLVS